MFYKVVLISFALFMSMPAMSAEQLSCVHVVSEDNKAPVIKKDAHVDLYIDGDTLLSRVRVPAASKDITFKECRSLKPTGKDNFTKWFGHECRKMSAIDDSPFSVDAYFSGSYAAISRKLTPQDSMWETLSRASKDLGIEMPNRTFIIYNDKQPIFEFFCRQDSTFKDNGEIPNIFRSRSPNPARVNNDTQT